jgi:predicted enzyme related to lactoylglutathione lyase
MSTIDTVQWFEMTGPDAPRLQSFYAETFGWKVRTEDSGYGMVAAAEGSIGGGIGPTRDGAPAHVTVYVGTDDVAASLARAERHGGKVVMPLTDLGDVEIGLFADPAGNVVGLARDKAKME